MLNLEPESGAHSWLAQIYFFNCVSFSCLSPFPLETSFLIFYFSHHLCIMGLCLTTWLSSRLALRLSCNLSNYPAFSFFNASIFHFDLQDLFLFSAFLILFFCLTVLRFILPCGHCCLSSLCYLFTSFALFLLIILGLCISSVHVPIYIFTISYLFNSNFSFSIFIVFIFCYQLFLAAICTVCVLNSQTCTI